MSFATVALVLVTCWMAKSNKDLLKKYDQQREIDIFYHSYPYRKELRDKISNIWDDRFSREMPDISRFSPPWQYRDGRESRTISQVLNMRNHKNYQEILNYLKEACFVFSEHKRALNNSIKNLEEFDKN